MGTRAEKVKIVADLADKLGRAQSVILMDFRGLNVGQTQELRRSLREAGVEFRVVKNTLARRASQTVDITGRDEFEGLLVGPTAMAFGYEDPVAPARELAEFAKNHRQVTLKGGLVDGRALDEAGVKALAELPPREQLLARVAGGISGPLTGFAYSVSAILRSFAYAVEGLRQQREAS